MGSCWINGGAIAGTIDYYRNVSINDEELDSRYVSAQRNMYRMRNRTVCRSRHSFFSGWPLGGFIDPDLSGGHSPIANWEQQNSTESYEYWRVGEGGYTTPYFIRGFVFDANGNPVGGVRVRSYVNSTGAFDGECLSAGDGSYEVPCYASGEHYVVAYVDGSPDTAGVSINSLVPVP